MARTLSLPRLAARLAVVIPFAAFVPAACGGFDTIPFDSDGAVSPDGALADGTTSDVTLGDSTVGDEMMADGTVGDGSFTDTTVNDARADSADAADAADAFDGTDASLAPFDPLLKSAARFTIFAGQTVTNANVSTVSAGDLGVYPSPTAIGTTPPILLLGAFHLGDGVAQTAQTDLLAAYTAITPANLPGCIDKSATNDLGGQTLPPGIYCFSSTAAITGTLTLDAGAVGPSAKWYFQITSSLTTGSLMASPAHVIVIGANPCNVYWQVGSSATISTDANFSGNILSFASVTLNARATLTGRALALAGGSVTMDTNTVSIAACPTAPMLPDDAGLDAGTDAADAADAADSG